MCEVLGSIPGTKGGKKPEVMLVTVWEPLVQQNCSGDWRAGTGHSCTCEAELSRTVALSQQHRLFQQEFLIHLVSTAAQKYI